MKSCAIIISTLLVLTINQCMTALVAPASAKAKSLVTRQIQDYGPAPAINCTMEPSKCPKKGSSGTLNFPVDHTTLITIWDNSGYVNVSYTPIKKKIPEGSVRTSSIIFTLRQYFFGVPVFDDKFVYLGSFSVPADIDFSVPLKFKLAIPSRIFDGDNNSDNDVKLGSPDGENYGTYGFQVFEQQVFQPLNVSEDQPLGYLIQFQSAGPIVNVTYIVNQL